MATGTLNGSPTESLLRLATNGTSTSSMPALSAIGRLTIFVDQPSFDSRSTVPAGATAADTDGSFGTGSAGSAGGGGPDGSWASAAVDIIDTNTDERTVFLMCVLPSHSLTPAT